MLMCDRRRCLSRIGWPIFILALILYIWFRILMHGSHSMRRDIHKDRVEAAYQMMDVEAAPVVHLQENSVSSNVRNERCTHTNCFDVYRCDTLTSKKITVYVYPIRKYVDSSGSLINDKTSNLFKEIIRTITESEYYTSDPENACLFVPSIDLLSQSYVKVEESSLILASLSHWNSSHLRRGGANHLIFNFIPGSYPFYHRTIDIHTDDAVIAGGGFDTWSFRSAFDVAIPVYSIFSQSHHATATGSDQRKYLLVSSQYESVSEEMRSILQELESKHISQVLLISDRCNSNDVFESNDRNTARCTRHGSTVKYPQVLKDSIFCIILPTAFLATPLLSESFLTGCIPVIVSDNFVLPFQEKIDWKRASIRIREQMLPNVLSILSNISEQRMRQTQRYGSQIYEKYFKSIKAITLTTLEILNDRLIPSSIPRKDNDERCYISDA